MEYKALKSDQKLWDQNQTLLNGLSQFELTHFELCQNVLLSKVGCVFQMVIWFEFRMEQYRDNYPRKDASHFSKNDFRIKLKIKILEKKWMEYTKLTSIWSGGRYLNHNLGVKIPSHVYT